MLITQATAEESLIAIRFFYTGSEPGMRLETLPFYLYKIRSFLRRHMGDAVWLKGNIIEKPAYLIFRGEIEGEVRSLLKNAVSEERGKFRMEHVRDPVPVILKYARDQRVAVGFLKLPNISLGNYESLADEREREENELVRRGFWLTEYEFIRAEHAELRGEWAILHDVARKFDDGREVREDEIAIRVDDLHTHKTFMSSPAQPRLIEVTA